MSGQSGDVRRSLLKASFEAVLVCSTLEGEWDSCDLDPGETFRDCAVDAGARE
jgi:hypothetical protein